jgi:hypothetical protein
VGDLFHWVGVDADGGRSFMVEDRWAHKYALLVNKRPASRDFTCFANQRSFLPTAHESRFLVQRMSTTQRHYYWSVHFYSQHFEQGATMKLALYNAS